MTRRQDARGLADGDSLDSAAHPLPEDLPAQAVRRQDR
tara:strand:+ start:630 stop:743 length:114 start_codon:yes stop_codon:yes gene_type:complete